MARAADWQESIIADERLNSASDVFVRSIAELETEAKRLFDELYFDGLDVFCCYEGRFRFSFNDRDPVEIGPEEVVVIYPRHKVTIDALSKNNRLFYCIFDGKNVEAYFDGIGYFDGAKGKTHAHDESFKELLRQYACNNAAVGHKWHCLSFLTNILVTQWREMRQGTHALAFDAVKLIHQNLLEKQIRLDPLCEQLGVCRSYLHRVFRHAGLGSPSSFVRAKQLRMAEGLLVNTRMSISEIANRSGFLSTSHFVTFFKRMAGKSPSQFRNNPNPD